MVVEIPIVRLTDVTVLRILSYDFKTCAVYYLFFEQPAFILCFVYYVYDSEKMNA